MRIAAFASILSATYTDLMDIYRHERILNTDGTEGIGMADVPKYQGIKCRLSFESKDFPESDAEDSNPINQQIKIFCPPDIDIKKGDRLVIHRMDEAGNSMHDYDGIANLPFIYATHKEVEIVEVGDA